MHWLMRMAALLLATSIMAQPISAAPTQPEPLQDSAVEQIQVLMQEKKNRSPAQRKMDTHLVFTARQDRHEFISLHGTNLQLRTQHQPDGRVLVDMDAEVTPAVLAAIEQAGGKVIAPVPGFHAIRALLPSQAMETLAARSDVYFMKPAVKARTNAGSVMSEGYYAHGVNTASNLFGVTGAGMKIGVLSDSVYHLTNAVATGDLPANVTVLSGQSGTDISGNSGEGTAMLEIVHDLAPNAALYFASAFYSEASFATNIVALQQAGCNIIVDDVSYDDEPPFQDGIVAQAVNQVTTNGALYFSSASNFGNKSSGSSGTWEGDFVNGGSLSGIIKTDGESGYFHNFGGSIYNPVTAVGDAAMVQLFWSDPWNSSGCTNDYDLFVLNSTGSSIDDYSVNYQNGLSGSNTPYEVCNLLNAGEKVVIVLNSGTGRFLHLETLGGELQYNTNGCIRGHACATNAFAVAAVSAASRSTPFTTANTVESFSSDGPRRIFYYPDGTAITPGNFSSTGGLLLQKPDIAAADGVQTSIGLAGLFENPFYGTSAAAPHAAAIAALLWSYRPSLSPARIRSALMSGTLDIGTAGWDADSGNGIVMAVPAMQNILPRLTVTSVFGSLAPGSLTTNMNTPVSESITSPAINGTTQYVCTGATVASNASILVSSTNVTLTLTNDATLTWNWLPQAYWLSVATNGQGAIASAPASGWCATGSVVSLAATPSNYWSFSNWTGDVNGIVLAGNAATATMSQARSIIGSFGAILATNQTPLWWLAQYGLPTNNAGALATSATPGMLNWQKYIAELNPTNPASVLEITRIGTNGVAFSPVATDRVYATYFTTNLVSSNWTQNVFRPGTGTTMFIAFTNQTAKGYYRVGVQLP